MTRSAVFCHSRWRVAGSVTSRRTEAVLEIQQPTTERRDVRGCLARLSPVVETTANGHEGLTVAGERRGVGASGTYFQRGELMTMHCTVASKQSQCFEDFSGRFELSQVHHCWPIAPQVVRPRIHFFHEMGLFTRGLS